MAHVWRVIGYYLGIPDTSNFVQDSFEQTLELLKEMFQKIYVPSILRIDAISLMMSKNIAAAFGLDYHVIVYAAMLRKLKFLQL